MLDWDDLRFVLAVARAGSTLRAARDLGVNQTTVARRIAHLESAIGEALFETRPSGQSLTALGQIVAGGAERVEAEVMALESAIEAQRRLVSGAIRFTSSDVYAGTVVAPFLHSFRRHYPGVTVELIADNRRLDLSRGEADVALRAGSRPEGAGIVAQRLPDAGWTLYCSHIYAKEHGMPSGEKLGQHVLVVAEGAMARLPAYEWLTRAAAGAAVAARSNNMINLVSALKAGLGISMLPCFVGDAETELMRCLPAIRELDSEIWLIVREEIRAAAHVRAFVDSLSAHMQGLRRQQAGDDDAAAVIASQRVPPSAGPMTGSAKPSRATQ